MSREDGQLADDLARLRARVGREQRQLVQARRGGRYREMFELQARRFADDTDEEGPAYVRLA